MTKSRGFTIAELAVAVAVLAVLLFSAMVPFSTQVELRNVAETRRTLDTIREAIIGFAQANGRLPCPADGNIAFGLANAGIEKFDGTNCVAALGGGAFGVVPWATLGVSETDSWGRRISYRISPAFADAITQNTWQSRSTAVPATFTSQNTPAILSPGDQNPTCPPSSLPAVAPFTVSPVPAQSSFALCTLGDITVYTRSAPGPAAAPLVAVVPAIIISHGKNGFGAWQSNGIQLSFPGTTPAASDERGNANGGATPAPPLTWAFFSRTPTSAESGCADPVPSAAGAPGTPLCEFDDIVVAISTNALMARMVAAGKLP